jgi:hypothetical protein
MNVSFEVEAFLVREMLTRIDELDERYGPRPCSGPVTIEFREDSVRVLISTPAQGTFAYTVNAVGELVDDTRPLHAS